MKKKKKLIYALLLGIVLSFSLSLYMNPNSNNRLLVPFMLIAPLTIFSYNILDSLYLKIKKMSIRDRKLIFIFSAVTCGVFSLSFLFYKNYVLPPNFIIKFVVYASITFIIYISIIMGYTYILDVEVKANNFIKLPRKRILLYALPCIIVWLFYLIAFYPGVMTADSMNQWSQMITGDYWDSNPVVHTMFNFIITRIWNSPAAIALVQILILSLIWGYCMYRFETFGFDKKILYAVTVVFSLNPVNGIFSITLWKDILYSGFILLFTMNLINILVDNNWIKKRTNLIFFIISAAGVIFFRHNGILPFSFTIILLIWIYRKEAKPYIITVGIILVMFFFIKGPVYKLMHVHPASSSEAFGIPTQQIAAVIKEKGYLTEEQKEKLNEIMPLDAWAENYMPGNVDYIKFHKSFNTDKMMEDRFGFLKLWTNICIQNPQITLEAYGDQTAIAWSVKGYTNWGSRGIIENKFGLKQKTLSNSITYIANKALNFSQKEDISKFFWRPALPMFLIIMAMFISILRNNAKYILVVCPVLLNIASVLAATPAQDFRYLYANTLTFLVILIFSFIKVDDTRESKI